MLFLQPREAYLRGGTRRRIYRTWGRTELLWYEKGLAEAFTIVVKGHLGESDDCEKEIRVPNRIARIDRDGLSYEGEPRHAEMLIKAFS